MSDVSDPILIRDADVNGSGAPLNYYTVFRALENSEMFDISNPLLTCDVDTSSPMIE